MVSKRINVNPLQKNLANLNLILYRRFKLSNIDLSEIIPELNSLTKLKSNIKEIKTRMNYLLMLINQQTFANFLKINTRNINVITLRDFTANPMEIKSTTSIIKQKLSAKK